jgi:hypothetical protein
LFIYSVDQANDQAKGLYMRFERDNFIVSSTPYAKDKGYELVLTDIKRYDLKKA